ncbi:protein Mdm4 isoform X1 [Taeniopygia guttata]|uniref:protein Mdm4 isoform X1 n=2 Tax=Taeniopygia guttata TaxID=59729 RepID=UPI003BB8E3B5
MSKFPNSSQAPGAGNSCGIAPGQASQVVPKLPLLRILRAAGAQGDSFTLKEVMHFLGQYILGRRLYDPRQQHLVHCAGDPLGALLGLRGFSLREPSPVYEMLKRNLSPAALPDAAQTLPKEQSVAKPSPDQLQLSQEEGSDSGILEGDSKSSAPATSEPKCDSCEDNDLLENLSKSKKPKLDLVFEEWDVAGLPWWFLGNLRSNYKSRSNGSTDIQTNQDIDTAIVSDTTDDLWFLNECPLDQGAAGLKVEVLDCEEVTEGDTKVPEDVCLDELEDSQCLSDDTDTEAASEDSWQCSKCRKFNSPGKRYCFRCWALRKDWYRDCPKLPHSLSLSNINSMENQEQDEGMDVPDCRRTISAPAGQPKPLFLAENKSCADPGGSIESLDLARDGKSRDFAKLKKEEEVESLESIKTLLNPCFLCQHRPRDGNIVHGRTAHLVACFRCARMLKKKRSPCPVCRKEIKMVIRIFMG